MQSYAVHTAVLAGSVFLMAGASVGGVTGQTHFRILVKLQQLFSGGGVAFAHARCKTVSFDISLIGHVFQCCFKFSQCAVCQGLPGILVPRRSDLRLS